MMAHKPRLYLPGAFCLLLNWVNQQQPIFHDEQDYQTLMAVLVLPKGCISLKKISEVLAQGWGLQMEQAVRRGGPRTMSRLREEIRFAATHFFHLPIIQIAHLLQSSPSAISRILRRAQTRLTAEPGQLERIQGLSLAE